MYLPAGILSISSSVVRDISTYKRAYAKIDRSTDTSRPRDGLLVSVNMSRYTAYDMTPIAADAARGSMYVCLTSAR